LLTYLGIRDFAIIDELALELGPGLTALTGETGAGKSIVVDALALAAGGRAAADVVRQGADRAEIAATFDVGGRTPVRRWLEAQAIECDGECILRRVVGRDGRSRAFINGQPVPLQTLRELGEQLVDIHGQQEFVSLMRRAAQLELLDAHGRHEALVQQTRDAYERWRALREQFAEHASAGRDRDARLELLRYQVRELQALGLKSSEIPELLAEQRRHHHSGRLVEGARQALELVYEQESFSAHQAVARALASVRNISALDPNLGKTETLLEEGRIALREAADALRHYLESMDVDPERQEWVERRVASIEDLARKHRLPATELPSHLEQLSVELDRLESHESTLETLQAQLATGRSDYGRAAAQLTAARRSAASDLTRSVTRLMQKLGMTGGQFEATVASDAANEPAPIGLDTVEFIVSANPGQPLKPVARVASGGELSRISLAIQVAALGKALTPCLVFDEVDAGVGGAVAEIVGRQLAALGERAQVLCVTHLPQVASQADHHIRVTKLTDGRSTRTTLSELKGTERVEELARMLGGVEITQKARDHAREMLRRAEGGATRARTSR
jgi:DNA repair protein RecN (Recombination protein N)